MKYVLEWLAELIELMGYLFAEKHYTPALHSVIAMLIIRLLLFNIVQVV